MSVHGNADVNLTLDDIVRQLREFVAEREWAQFHDPKNLTLALASEVGELAALYRWVSNTASDSFSEQPENLHRIQEEVADVAICLILLSDRLDIDLFRAISQKLARNGERYPVELSRGKAECPVRK